MFAYEFWSQVVKCVSDSLIIIPYLYSFCLAYKAQKKYDDDFKRNSTEQVDSGYSESSMKSGIP
jgi:hypothetical protein